MNVQDIETLKASINKRVKIRTCDGECLLAQLLEVSEEDKDIIYDLISTSRESQYEKFDEQPAYRMEFKDIQTVEAVSS